MSPFSRLTGVVLAGGKNSRLGRDKAALVLDASGTDLLTRTARLLQSLLPRVLVVGRTHAGFESLPDDAPGAGPVGGVATALRHAGTACLVLSCDLPFMDRATLSLLLQAWAKRRPETLLTAFAHKGTGRLEPLAAVYEPSVLPYCEACLTEGRHKLSRVVPERFQELLFYEDEAALPFFSLNYPADLAAAYLILRAREI